MTIVTVGIDLAKNVFAVHGVDESVHHGGDAKKSLSSVWFGDFHAPHWLGTVAARDQLREDGRPVRFEVSAEFINSHAVNARCAFVAPAAAAALT